MGLISILFLPCGVGAGEGSREVSSLERERDRDKGRVQLEQRKKIVKKRLYRLNQNMSVVIYLALLFIALADNERNDRLRVLASRFEQLRRNVAR